MGILKDIKELVGINTEEEYDEDQYIDGSHPLDPVYENNYYEEEPQQYRRSKRKR